MDMNGKMEFTYQFSDKEPKVTMLLSPDSDLNEVLECFEKFLFAAGYSFEGRIEINGNFDPTLYDPKAEEN